MAYADVMLNDVTVHLAIDAPQAMNRHRVSVWDENGLLLSGPTAEPTVDLSIRDGATIHVEASVPSTPKRNENGGRDEQRWELRAANDAHTVLNLGRKAKIGQGTAIEIRVDGAA